MLSGVYLIFVLIALAIMITLAWRFASRRHPLPCPVWMKGLLDFPSGRGMSARTQKTIRHMDLRPGMNVLDAGCGPGRLTIPAAAEVGPRGEVTAIDIQEGMLLAAQERAHEAGFANIRFLRVALGDGMLAPARYDRAVLVTVLGEIPDREAAFRDLFAALRPGGILVVEETIRDPHFQPRGTVRRLAAAAGFLEKEFFGNRFSFTITLVKPPASGS
jgi:ubiquinone/menaquinone biosynthesis C-methylase UbiE